MSRTPDTAARRAAAGAAGDHRRPADRDRDDHRAGDDRVRVYNAGLGVPIHTALGEGPFKTELIAAGGLDDRARALADGLLVLAQRRSRPWARHGRRAESPAHARIHRGIQVHRPQRRDRRRAAAAEPDASRARDAEGGAIAWRSRWRSRCRSASGSATCTAARSWRSTSATSAARCRASSCWRSATPSSGSGSTVVELALVILAVPPIVTNAYLGVDGVDRRACRRRARAWA